MKDAEDHAALLTMEINILAAAIDANMEEQWEEFFGKTAMEMAEQALKDINAEIDKIKEATGDEEEEEDEEEDEEEEPPAPPPQRTYMVSSFTTGVDTAAQRVLGYVHSTSGAKKVAASLRYTNERDIPKLRSDAKAVMAHKYSIGQEISWSRGTHYIPETQPYLLHRGETVSPAGQSGGGSSDIVYITIHNTNAINSELDAERIAKMQAETIRQRLADETGKTKYRLR